MNSPHFAETEKCLKRDLCTITYFIYDSDVFVYYGERFAFVVDSIAFCKLIADMQANLTSATRPYGKARFVHA